MKWKNKQAGHSTRLLANVNHELARLTQGDEVTSFETQNTGEERSVVRPISKTSNATTGDLLMQPDDRIKTV